MRGPGKCPWSVPPSLYLFFTSLAAAPFKERPTTLSHAMCAMVRHPFRRRDLCEKGCYSQNSASKSGIHLSLHCPASTCHYFILPLSLQLTKSLWPHQALMVLPYHTGILAFTRSTLPCATLSGTIAANCVSCYCQRRGKLHQHEQSPPNCLALCRLVTMRQAPPGRRANRGERIDIYIRNDTVHAAQSSRLYSMLFACQQVQRARVRHRRKGIGRLL